MNKIKLIPLTDFREMFKSLESNFGDSTFYTELLVEDNHIKSIRVLIRSIARSTDEEDFNRHGQLKFTAQVIEVKRHNGTSTLFGHPMGHIPGVNPFITGYTTTTIGSRNAFFETNNDSLY